MKRPFFQSYLPHRLDLRAHLAGGGGIFQHQKGLIKGDSCGPRARLVISTSKKEGAQLACADSGALRLAAEKISS